MKEHPIPQDITNYRFHIIGSMTLKQFLEIGAGVVFAAILYKLALPAFIKWPAMIFSAGLGAAAAFLPIEERPLDHWIITYFRVLFKPTQFYWRREPKIPFVFTESSTPSLTPLEPELDLAPMRRERMKEYMASLKPSARELDAYDLDNSARVQTILESFSEVSVVQNTTIRPQYEKPDLTPRIRTLRKSDANQNIEFINMGSDFSIESAPQEIQVAYPSETQIVLPDVVIQGQLDAQLAPDQVASNVKIAQSPLVQIESEGALISSSQNSSVINLTQDQISEMIQPTPNTPNEIVQPNQEAMFNTNLPFPSAPTEPNKLVGMVLTNNGELVPGAVVEVRNNLGMVERVVKTNALGQFFITTPLRNGKYVVSIESDGFTFPQSALDITGSILQPLEVRAVA